MLELFAKHKQNIHEEIKIIFSDLIASLSEDATTYNKLILDLQDFCLNGKGIRGSFLVFTVENLAPEYLKQAYTLAAAVEIMHASVLVHDDIIDDDDLRRNLPTLKALFSEKNNPLKSISVGDQKAICIGDIGFFLAFNSLEKLDLPLPKFKQILKTLAYEFILVGIGEIGDITISSKTENAAIDNILAMYKYKTARYTFSLPLLLASQLCSVNESVILDLVKYGENLGIQYQIKDDELSLFGNQDEFGKKLGNDIVENKQTIFRTLLYPKLNSSDLVLANQVFGNKSSTPNEINQIIELFKKYEIDKEVNKLSQQYKTNLNQLRSSLHLHQSFVQALQKLEIELQSRNT